MSATPGAELARLKVVYGHHWRIGRGVPNGPQFVAVEPSTSRRITAGTAGELEHALTVGEGRQA